MGYDKDMIKDKIEKLLEQITGQKAYLEHPTNLSYGDYSTNLALKLKLDSKEIVEKLKNNPIFEKVSVAGPGFINFTLSKEYLQQEVKAIITQGEKYGNLDIGKGKKIQVEFISANPTGPLTVGNARGGPYGDTLANVLEKAGFKTEKEYYINDCGMQIIALGNSVLKNDQAKYKGKYIDDLSKKIKEQDPFKAGQLSAKMIIKDLISKTTDRLGIKYGEWVFESDLYSSGKVDKAFEYLKEKDLIFEKDDAKWFKSSSFGDQRDRVVVKSNGWKTYLMGDIAYHRYKFEDKKFDKVINIWGADHHGDIPGLQAGVEAIGHKGKLEIVLLQFVTILEQGEKKKMSKRAGFYVEMDELLKKTGKDAVRFFFLQKSANTHLNFDMSLAKEQSSKNPVYYVQYAHARMSSILRKAADKKVSAGKDFKHLTTPAELSLVRQLIKFPEIVEETARDYQVQRLPSYALELANTFHRFYEQCRVLDDDQELASDRVGLIKATQIILKNVLSLMGIDAPNRM